MVLGWDQGTEGSDVGKEGQTLSVVAGMGGVKGYTEGVSSQPQRPGNTEGLYVVLFKGKKGLSLCYKNTCKFTNTTIWLWMCLVWRCYCVRFRCLMPFFFCWDQTLWATSWHSTADRKWDINKGSLGFLLGGLKMCFIFQIFFFVAKLN